MLPPQGAARRGRGEDAARGSGAQVSLLLLLLFFVILITARRCRAGLPSTARALRGVPEPTRGLGEPEPEGCAAAAARAAGSVRAAP